MEIPPNRVVRYLQLGLYDLALNSASIWLCAGCQTCSSRCPKNFEIAKLMDALRQISIELGVKPKDEKVLKFHKAFLRKIFSGFGSRT
jgi:heterodisulfide reductase subunit C2